jgi:DNA processing protein
LAIGEPGYPPALGQVDAPPRLIYVKGGLDLADIPIVPSLGPATAPLSGRNSPASSPSISRSKAS